MPPKPHLTHFLALPLVTPSSRPQLQNSLTRFRADACNQPDDTTPPILPPQAIRPVSTLHLTIGVMSLPTPTLIEAACSFLRSLDLTELLHTTASSHPNFSPAQPSPTAPSPRAKPPPPLSLTLQGLHPMGPPFSTSSLYAIPTPTHPLLPFATALRSAFTAAGYLVPDPRPLLLHATIANTIYVRRATSGKKRWGKGSAKVDARAVLERWGGEVWAEGVEVDRVVICEMGAKKVWGEGEGEGEGKERVVVDEVYTEVAAVELLS